MNMFRVATCHPGHTRLPILIRRYGFAGQLTRTCAEAQMSFQQVLQIVIQESLRHEFFIAGKLFLVMADGKVVKAEHGPFLECKVAVGIIFNQKSGNSRCCHVRSPPERFFNRRYNIWQLIPILVNVSRKAQIIDLFNLRRTMATLMLRHKPYLADFVQW